MNSSYFILYVSDQATSTAFYSRVLDCSPRLNVPGMTEFVLPDGAILGLMPESGIRRLLGPRLPDPASAHGIPRAELYLLVRRPPRIWNAPWQPAPLRSARSSRETGATALPIVSIPMVTCWRLRPTSKHPGKTQRTFPGSFSQIKGGRQWHPEKNLSGS